MYQFYYSEKTDNQQQPIYEKNVWDEMNITAIRPTMWEEHCLECSAPACFGQCTHYAARSDGRCKRFANGILVVRNERGVGNQSARIKFRKWANMMTIIFPAMVPANEYDNLIQNNQKLGKGLRIINKSPLPTGIRWQGIRTIEFIRRKKLRNLNGLENKPDAFVFHGYSFEKENYRLIMEIFDDHTSVYKYSWNMEPGENLIIIDKDKLDIPCWTSNLLVKIYPENDLEADIDILWCDFVQGARKKKEKAADKVKCVVWDLDNTLWDGTLIETENEDNLKMNAHVLDTIKELDARGILQSIASKNDFDSAWPMIEKLGISEYFLYPQIHWNAKSNSVEQIAKELNIGIDTLALIDDSGFEREQVKSVWPQVRTYDANEVAKILTYPEFDVMVTEESKKRRSMYQAEEKRRELQKTDNKDTVEFLKKCHLVVDIFEPTIEEEKMRCYELVVRTNQLNMSGKKYSPEEFETVYAKKDHHNFAFSCRDDFGEYGIVGYGQYRVEEQTMVFSEFAMSCRVAGKYVESALFSSLLKKENCATGIFEIQKTKKNVLLRNTLEDIGFQKTYESTVEIKYSFTQELKNKDIVLN